MPYGKIYVNLGDKMDAIKYAVILIVFLVVVSIVGSDVLVRVLHIATGG